MVYKNIAKFLIMYFNKKVWYYDNIMDIRNTYKELKPKSPHRRGGLAPRY